MKNLYWDSIVNDSKSKTCLLGLFLFLFFAFAFFFMRNPWDGKQYDENYSASSLQRSNPNSCMNRCIPSGSELLPRKIVCESSNFEMYPLWENAAAEKQNKDHRKNLLAIPVGFEQRDTVARIVNKFGTDDFAVMLFHYDGVVDKWRDFPFYDAVLHVSAVNQTKWWFAKRFLHPDIVAEYEYIFLWDEDIGVENFDPNRYLKIVEKESLEISQPALDRAKSIVHHPITARNSKTTVHRRMYKFKGGRKCFENSTAPPCVGWVEMMVPVFSRAAWRCTWYMLQNDLIHAWGMDKQLGYCAQGDRTKKIGVVDSEYVVHLGLSTLGVFSQSKEDNYSRIQVFWERWKIAEKDDDCWVDQFKEPLNRTTT